MGKGPRTKSRTVGFDCDLIPFLVDVGEGTWRAICLFPQPSPTHAPTSINTEFSPAWEDVEKGKQDINLDWVCTRSLVPGTDSFHQSAL